MGDGGVACVPSQLVMERFSSEALCGGNGGFNSKSIKYDVECNGGEKKKKMMKNKKKEGVLVKRVVKKKGESASLKISKELGNGGEIGVEIEEGELGTLKCAKGELENDEFVPEKSRKSEIEREEIVSDKSRKEDPQFVSGKWRKGDVFRHEDKCETGFCRGGKEEPEKGEFIPERWEKNELGFSRIRSRKSEREWTPPYGKYSGDDASQRKEFSRSGSQHSKSSSRWQMGQDRNLRISSKIADDDGGSKNEYNNGKNQRREYSSSTRKHHAEFVEYGGLKTRRISDDGNRSTYSEHYSRQSVERGGYRTSSSSRISSSDRYQRHYESSKTGYDRHTRTPERSPRDRGRYHDYRERSPVRRERSPHDRNRYHDHRNRSPSYSERSPPPQDRSRHHDRQERTPNYLDRSPPDRNKPNSYRERSPLNYPDRSPPDRGRPNNHRETSRKNGVSSEKSQSTKGQEGKVSQRDPSGRDLNSSTKDSEDGESLRNGYASGEKDSAGHQSHKEEQSQSPIENSTEPMQVDGAPEELLSMEEDMDICDTPPHVPVVDTSVVADVVLGKWIYIDQFGTERGPSTLNDLKALVEEGILVSDHMTKHVDSDRWVSVENAASPLVTMNFPAVVSDTVTQLASPPEAPGNLLTDVGDTGQLGNLPTEELQLPVSRLEPSSDDSLAVSNTSEDLHIDERVGALLEGFTVVPGRELETVGELLQTTFEHADWERLGSPEGFASHTSSIVEQHDQRTDEESKISEITSKEAAEPRSIAHSQKDHALVCGDSNSWFSGLWSCKGGDWKRNDEAAHDRLSRKKLVLNDSFPLCQMPKSGYEDPRWHRKDELYYPSQSRRLDLPAWAFTCPDEGNDSDGLSRTSQTKNLTVRGVKGTVAPVVRINACVVKDHGSFVSEPHSKSRGRDSRDRYSSRSGRFYSSGSDVKLASAEGSFLKTDNGQNLQRSRKSTVSIITPKDRLCTADDLQLHLGDWYYLDGAGHERGPLEFSELQLLVDQGIIQKHTSVFRKNDSLWVPVNAAVEIKQENSEMSAESSGAAVNRSETISSSFHNLHPQFIGYTRGKLHELVMKSYKSREFAAAINEVLDPWISRKQPRKEMDKHMFSSMKSEEETFSRYDDHTRPAKRARMLIDVSEENYEMDDGSTVPKDESTFEELCGNTTFYKDHSAVTDMGSWGQLDGHILARVCHFLRADIRSLAFASLTCKQWRAAVKFYKDISRQMDLSACGSNCPDAVVRNIMNDYDKEKVVSVVLSGCTNVTPGMLEEILRSFPCISAVDIRGCVQFGELTHRYPSVNWVKWRSSHGTKFLEESSSKTRSLKQIAETSSSVSKTFKGLGSHIDDSSDLREYFERDSASRSFRGSFYKRSKLYDARRSTTILSRDAQLRRLALKKSENAYKKMEKFLAFSLKDIMKENTSDFFVPKVAEIQDRMKNGYYAGRGLSSVREDISRMCKDAIKAKNRSGNGDNHIVTMFIQLANCMEENSKASHERDEMIKRWEDDSPAGFSSTATKYKRNKKVTERKYTRSNGTSSLVNGGSDSGEYSSDREIRRRLSKLNKRSMDSGSETSDGLSISSEDSKSDTETTASDTESDLDIRSESGAGDSKVDVYFNADEGFDSMSDNREWGARMTKASLVPPVTRKYEVIDRYVVVADEEEVRRKMRVSLPEDYTEKLNAQKSGTEDMEIPEVKDYKPRKQLGHEVLEQEVYGIDPYTHNLLLDSMPNESDWSLLDKHLFIEDVLLRALNKKVRQFTGTGNTPMIYSLRPVVETIFRNAEDDGDVRTTRLCKSILKAMDGRPDDNYVAYRKGLGVVCNKEGGFGEDDFVVEFLGEVYPAWKWFEKQDGIRSLQKKNKDPAPEFYNIYLERPKGDAEGYDLVVVDAMHKANYASRICHSCRPNCEAKLTAVDGQYQIGIYTVRPIGYGEEITFDYNSVTESKEEYEASVCLCGSQICRGSYLNLTGEGAYQKVLKDCHGLLDRYRLILEACELNSVSQEDYIDLGRAGLGSCLLGGLPDWLIAYSARLVRFINFERTKLPEEILRHNLEEKRKFFADICIEVEKSDAEVQAEGVYNQRLQNLALTLDKVRYVMRCVFDDPKKAPPPVERLSPEAAVSFLWTAEGSLVEGLLQSMAPHMDDASLHELKSKIRAHNPSGSDLQKELRKSLLWLRDEVRNLPCTYKCRHDAAADLLHIYAYTKCFFRLREYKTVTSPPVYISPLDLGPKYSHKLGSGFQEYCKTYGENYCLGQLINWHNQTNAEPDSCLVRASRGCLSLPDVSSFYARAQKPTRQRVYGSRIVRFMLARMEKQPQRPWPKDQIWEFQTSPKVFGTPMLDTILNNTPLEKEMMHWLKNRPNIFYAMWDR